MRAAAVLFGFGLLLRLLFVAAPHDGGPGWHAGFQGDAPVWQRLAQQAEDQRRDLAAERTTAAATGRPPRSELELARQGRLELHLPVRPPGMRWLVGALWNGDAARVAVVRGLFVVLGAVIAPLLWLLLRPHVAPGVAFAAAALCAASTNLLLLGSGLHVEGLYLVLVLLGLWLQPALTGARALPAALAWGALQGITTLVRAEHVLTVLALALLARLAGSSWRALLAAALAAAAVLLPWQLHANARVDAFNTQAPLAAPRSLPWDADALAALHALPAFAQRATAAFVADTVRVRGGSRVRAGDLDVVREAYGAMPEPLPHRFVALYGGLNFFLANSPEAAGGFSRAALDRPPPLTGGDHRYPPGLRGVLPRGGEIAFDYPPHLDAIVHGATRGWREITNDPAGALARLGRKAWHFAEGATGGLGGHALPIGLSGVRRPVDLVTATGAWANTWRAAVLATATVGLWRLRRVRALWPLFAFAATKLLVALGWFGYARHGALCVPLIALGVAAALHALVPARRHRVLAFAGLGALLVLELARWLAPPAVTVDGRGDPSELPSHDFAARTMEFR